MVGRDNAVDMDNVRMEVEVLAKDNMEDSMADNMVVCVLVSLLVFSLVF